MLITASSLTDYPILSLHVGGEVARVTQIIVDPNSLNVIAFRVDGPLIGDEVGDLLPVDSIREFSRMGMIIDSTDELVEGEELVRLRDILQLKFELNGLKVITKQKSKLGKVSDYVIDVSSWVIHQLIVQRPIMKALFDPELTISRKSIIEVNDYEVIVKDEYDKLKKVVIANNPATDFVPNFVNPFREPELVTKQEHPEKS